MLDRRYAGGPQRVVHINSTLNGSPHEQIDVADQQFIRVLVVAA
jgi:hypothetical protein